MEHNKLVELKDNVPIGKLFCHIFFLFTFYCIFFRLFFLLFILINVNSGGRIRKGELSKGEMRLY